VTGDHAADLLYELVARDIKIRYRRSVLGVAWSQLSPLALMGVMFFVFTHVIVLRIPHYAVFVLVGLTAWTWLASAVVGSTESVVASADLIRQPGFPRLLVPVVPVITHLAQFVLGLPVVLVASFAVAGLHPTVLALPVVVALQALVLLGPAYLLAAAHVRFHDTAHLVGVVLLPVFYATPVFYDVTMVPARFHFVYALNPMARLVEAYRDVLLHHRWPDASGLLYVFVVGVCLLVAGTRVYASRAGAFADDV
jgi:lipopolysaccharide transport system permease protein